MKNIFIKIVLMSLSLNVFSGCLDDFPLTSQCEVEYADGIRFLDEGESFTSAKKIKFIGVNNNIPKVVSTKSTCLNADTNNVLKEDDNDNAEDITFVSCEKLNNFNSLPVIDNKDSAAFVELQNKYNDAISYVTLGDVNGEALKFGYNPNSNVFYIQSAVQTSGKTSVVGDLIPPGPVVLDGINKDIKYYGPFDGVCE